MSKIVKVSESDYRVKVQNGGTITLDTGVNAGTVYVTGNLEVQGTTTTIDTANLTIEDNVILLNRGESGAGVTEVLSGLEIDRGSLDNAQFLWNESIDKFVIQLDTGTLSGIVVGNISTNPLTNLEFDMQGGGGTLRVTNSTGYESRVLDPNDIPNKQFINDYVYATGGSAKVDRLFFPVTATFGAEDTLVLALETSLKFYVRSGTTLNQRLQINSTGVDIDNVNIFENTVQNIDLVNNLILTALNNNVEIDAVLNLNDQIATPSPTGGSTKIYSKSTAGPGKTGIFFTNNTTSDELVAKNRALLFSILF